MIIHDIPQGSAEWKLLRLGIPTASEFSRLITSKNAPSASLPLYAGELAAELYAGKSLSEFDGNTWMERGKDMEQEAADLYAFTTDRNVQTCGFITMDDGLCGCSPDRLVDDDGLLEIKCQKAERHLESLHYYAKHNKCPPGKVQQTQGQMWVTGRKWSDLMFYHPDLPPLIIRQTPDLAMHAALAEGVKAVIAERDAQLSTLRQQHKQAS